MDKESINNFMNNYLFDYHVIDIIREYINYHGKNIMIKENDKIEICDYKDGEKHGIFYSYKTHYLHSICMYSCNKKEGIYYEWFTGIHNIHHSDKLNVKKLLTKGLYAILNYVNNVMEDRSFFYSYSKILDVTKLHNVSNFKNGYLHGEQLTYYQNGNIMESVLYENGRKNGKTKSYNSEGFLLKEENYEDNYLNGKIIQYYWNTTVVHEILSYKCNLISGEYKSYSPDNILVMEGNYYNNNKVGLWIQYSSKSGVPISKIIYSDEGYIIDKIPC